MRARILHRLPPSKPKHKQRNDNKRTKTVLEGPLARALYEYSINSVLSFSAESARKNHTSSGASSWCPILPPKSVAPYRHSPGKVKVVGFSAVSIPLWMGGNAQGVCGNVVEARSGSDTSPSRAAVLGTVLRPRQSPVDAAADDAGKL